MHTKIKIFFRKNCRWILFFLCLLFFFAFAEDVFYKEIMKEDVYGYQLMKTYLIRPSLTPVVKVITWFGSASCLVPFTLLFFLFIKNKKIGICIGSNLFLVTILNLFAKFLFHRPRPDFQIIVENGYSFPSGHSMVSLAFYGFLLYLSCRYIKNKYLKGVLCVFLPLLILMIGVSRIYLGVHYTSDVCAGFLLSMAYLILYISFLEKKFLKKEKIN